MNLWLPAPPTHPGHFPILTGLTGQRTHFEAYWSRWEVGDKMLGGRKPQIEPKFTYKTAPSPSLAAEPHGGGKAAAGSC